MENDNENTYAARGVGVCGIFKSRFQMARRFVHHDGATALLNNGKTTQFPDWNQIHWQSS